MNARWARWRRSYTRAVSAQKRPRAVSLEILSTPAPLATAEEVVLDGLRAAVATRGKAVVVLAGGGTPLPLYRALARRQDVPWQDVVLTFGDERFVPYQHQESNYGTIQREFIAALPTPPAGVLPWPIRDDPHVSAAAYAALLEERLGGPASFDLVLLGIGADGHTASLFPGTRAALDERVALAVAVPGLGWRLSLGPRALSAGRTVMFLATGPEKADALRLNFPAATARLTPEGDGDAAARVKLPDPDRAPASAIGARERLLLVTDSL